MIIKNRCHRCNCVLSVADKYFVETTGACPHCYNRLDPEIMGFDPDKAKDRLLNADEIKNIKEN